MRNHKVTILIDTSDFISLRFVVNQLAPKLGQKSAWWEYRIPNNRIVIELSGPNNIMFVFCINSKYYMLNVLVDYGPF